MASTYDQNATAIAALSEGDKWKYLTQMSLALERLEKSVRSSADVRDKSMLESQLKMRKHAQDFTVAMQKIDAANARARLAAAAKIEATAIKSVEDYATKYAHPYDKIVQAAQDRGRRHATPGKARLGNLMGVLIQRATAPGMGFDRNNPKFLKTFEAVVAEADPAGEYFTYDKATGKVTGFTQAGRALTGITPPDDGLFATQTIAGTAIGKLWDDYKVRKQKFEEQTRDGKATLDKAESLRQQAEKATDPNTRLRLVQAYQKHMQQYFGMAFNQYSIGDLTSVQKRINAATDTSSTYTLVKGLMEKLAKEALGTGPKASKLAEWVMRPKFQQWAKDHGFESIGTGTQDKDGTWSYLKGGDDTAAFTLYKAQQKKGKFNYGFMRNAGTGETVQVTLKDGTTLSGERAKVHAGDPKDILRIITPEGDVEFINTSEDIEGDVVILKEAPEKMGVREKIMGRRGVRQKDETARLVEEAAKDREGILEDVAMVGEQYVQDKSGRYLSQDEYGKRKEAVLEGQRTGHATMHDVDEKPYLVVGDEVYRVDVEQLKKGKIVVKLVPADEKGKDGKSSLVADVKAIKGAPLLIKDGESARYGTKADFIDGKLKTIDTVDPAGKEHGRLSKAAEKLFTASVTPKVLGVRLSDDPGYVEGRAMGPRSGVTARTPRVVEHLPEDPVEPKVVVPAKPWSPDDLDKEQKKAYDAVVARIEHTHKAPPGFDQKQLDRLEAKTPLTVKEAGALKRLQSAAQQVKQRNIDIDKAVVVLNQLYSPLGPDDAPPDEEALGAAFGSRSLRLVDEAPKPEPKPEPKPTGPLSKAERKALTSPLSDPRVFSQLAARHKADPATTSFTVGEQLEVVDPTTKKRKLTEFMKQRRAVRPGAIVTSSTDLGKLMQVTKDKGVDVDVYETDEGLYMAMQRGKPLPAGRAGRLLTDIKTPKPVQEKP